MRTEGNFENLVLWKNYKTDCQGKDLMRTAVDFYFWSCCSWQSCFIVLRNRIYNRVFGRVYFVILLLTTEKVSHSLANWVSHLMIPRSQGYKATSRQMGVNIFVMDWKMRFNILLSSSTRQFSLGIMKCEPTHGKMASEECIQYQRYRPLG